MKTIRRKGAPCSAGVWAGRELDEKWWKSPDLEGAGVFSGSIGTAKNGITKKKFIDWGWPCQCDIDLILGSSTNQQRLLQRVSVSPAWPSQSDIKSAQRETWLNSPYGYVNNKQTNKRKKRNLIEFSVLPIGSLLMDERRIPSSLLEVRRSSLLATICHRWGVKCEENVRIVVFPYLCQVLEQILWFVAQFSAKELELGPDLANSFRFGWTGQHRHANVFVLAP